MIFITTGTQEPFDRLLMAMMPYLHDTDERVVIQAKTQIPFPAHVEVYAFLNPMDFEAYFNAADIVISHAGMGTIILALTLAKPLIIFPRQAALKEHRNDHQMATSKKIAELNLVYVAYTAEALLSELLSLQHDTQLAALSHIGDYAAPSLINSLAGYINP